MHEIPEFDVTKIDFPSDDLSIKVLRQRWPEAIDTRIDDQYSDGLPKPFDLPISELLHNMLTMERDLAKATFGLEFGEKPNFLYANNDIKILIEDLGQLYIEFGLASGQHHADQFIRRIEAQSLAQARQHVPPRS